MVNPMGSETHHRYEYDSAVVTMGPIQSGTVWELDITLANRGETTETFQVVFEQAGANHETIPGSVGTIGPGRTGGLGLGAEVDPGITAFEFWWVRIFTTSRNLVPTMRFHVEGRQDPPVPEFFFGPGDFAVFELDAFRPAPPTTISG